MIIERSGMKCVDPMMELPIRIRIRIGIRITIDLDKISENGSNIYEWNQINQTRLEIDFDCTFRNEQGSSTFRRFGISKYLSGMNKVARHFEDLEYLNTINIQYSEILSNVNERGCWKLNRTELKDVRFGRSTFNHFESFHYYFALSMNRNHLFFFLQVHTNRV